MMIVAVLLPNGGAGICQGIGTGKMLQNLPFESITYATALIYLVKLKTSADPFIDFSPYMC